MLGCDRGWRLTRGNASDVAGHVASLETTGTDAEDGVCRQGDVLGVACEAPDCLGVLDLA